MVESGNQRVLVEVKAGQTVSNDMLSAVEDQGYSR